MTVAMLTGYGNDLDAQLATAESELTFLDNKFAQFLAATEHDLWDWTFGTNNQVEDTVQGGRSAIAGSIAQLHASFLEAVGGQPIAWNVWWELAKDTEKHMGTVSSYSNQYGDVGGRIDVIAGEGRKELDETIEGIKEALPSEGKLWLGVGVVVLILFLVLAIKLS